MLAPCHAKTMAVTLPRNSIELVIWIVISFTAGFVEELNYRGYLQTRFQGLGAPAALAITGQALIFGAGHSYEGLSRVVAIIEFGVISGSLVEWRHSLCPSIIGHAMIDIVAVLIA
jgi:membrane protease YdiL (CAAX protease family)